MRKMTLLAAVMALGVPVALADAPEGEKKEVGFARQHRPVLFERQADRSEIRPASRARSESRRRQRHRRGKAIWTSINIASGFGEAA